MKKQMKKQKECNKSNANYVGVYAFGDPHFKENSKTTPEDGLNSTFHFSHFTSNYSGITLIALIITIIVMLILVGVTINIALNGGLFGKAREGASGTQIELDKEILASAALGTMGENGEVNFKELDGNLPDGFKGSNGTYEKDGVTFKVDKYGGVTTKEKSTGDLALLEKYCLGKAFTDILNLDEVKFNNNDIIPNAEKDLIPLNESIDIDDVFLYFKFNDKVYKMSFNNEYDIEDMKVHNVELVYEPKGREGQKVEYDGDSNGQNEEWMILYDNGDNVEIIPINVMGDKLTLGKYDETAKDLKEDIDKDGKIDDTDKEIYSYNNAITRLNKYAESLIKNENKISVRSAGSNPDDPLSESKRLYESEELKNSDLSKKYYGLLKSGDNNFEQDLSRISYYFNVFEEGSNNFWLASRQITSYDTQFSFVIRTITTESSGGVIMDQSEYVCPVVKISSSIIENN